MFSTLTMVKVQVIFFFFNLCFKKFSQTLSYILLSWNTVIFFNAVSFRLFGFRTPFILLKIISQKSFLFWWILTLIFTMLKIKTEKFWKDVLIIIIAHYMLTYEIFLWRITFTIKFYWKSDWFLISASVVKLLRYVVLVQVSEENIPSPNYVSGKGRRILRAFSDNCGYSFLTLQQAKFIK